MYGKLLVTSLMNSLVNVKDVHLVYMPLILGYDNPGVNSSSYILHHIINEALKFNTEANKVPNLENEFSVLTSHKASQLICELIRMKR